MIGTYVCFAIILIAFGCVVHYINSSYEDYKEYMATQNKNNDR